ncbi:MAG: D-alanyl-lipoteichoic acid biosynthesis protein DltD [Coriobacteriia bacterium]|nr:D-alanyl-lipoteichoic acid biosynthesis protein DltD [Coriobacteriia bacterium]
MRRLKAIGLAFALFICAFTLYQLCLPRQGDIKPDLRFDYAMNSVKYSSSDYVTAGMTRDSMLLLGSSELQTKFISTHPANVFPAYDCGVNAMCVGQAHYQSLWHAIFAGSIASGLPEKRVALILSPQWFNPKGVGGVFRGTYSWELIRGFCENKSISQATKNAVLKRVVDVGGIDSGKIRGIKADSFLGALDAKATGIVDDLTVRRKLVGATRAVNKSPVVLQGSQAIDWDSLLADAQRAGEASCTNNDFGMYNEYFDKYVKPSLAKAQGSAVGAKFDWSPEYSDLELFLDVCKQSGIEPLIIVVPFNGKWMDYTGCPSDLRSAYYQKIKEICVSRNVCCADYSGSEYEEYFLCDTMHLGWRGWAHVDKDLAEFHSTGSLRSWNGRVSGDQ